MTSLPLMETFYSLQGEGYYHGHPAYFIRLAGCDVKCHWCDVRESWDDHTYPRVSITEITERALSSGAAIIVITGGEPTLYNLAELTTSLKQKGLQTHLQTAGIHKITGLWDWICLSPKKIQPPHTSVFSHVHELKIIIYHKSDFEWAERQAKLVPSTCQLYLQPEWSREEKMTACIVDYIKKNPKWALSVQLHKLIHVP